MSSSEPPQPVPLRRVEILLVEDHPDDVQRTREALVEQKIANTLHVVASGDDALAFLRGDGEFTSAPSPDLVLLSLDLPEEKGGEVLREVRRDPKLRGIPVVAITQESGDGADGWALALGAVDYVRKPVDFRHLAHVVQKVANFWIAIVTMSRDAPASSANLPRQQ